MTAFWLALAVLAVLYIVLGFGQALGLIRPRTRRGALGPPPGRAVQLGGLGLAFGGLGLLVLSVGIS